MMLETGEYSTNNSRFVLNHIRTEVVHCSDRRGSESEPDVCGILRLVEKIADYIWMDANDSTLRHLMYSVFYSNCPSVIATNTSSCPS